MRHRPLLLLALAPCIVVGFTAASVIGSDDSPVQSHGVLEAGGLAGVAGTESIEHVRPDPQSRGREWAVTVFKAKNGQTCVAPGRKQGNKAGDVTPDGRFVPYPIEDGGSCTDLSRVPAGAQITSTPSEGRTTVHGIAGPKVRQITLTVNGEARELDIGPRGVFFAVLGPEVTRESLKLSATLKDGSVVTLL